LLAGTGPSGVEARRNPTQLRAGGCVCIPRFASPLTSTLMARPTRFEHNRYVGDKRTQIVYDLDRAESDPDVATAVDELMAYQAHRLTPKWAAEHVIGPDRPPPESSILVSIHQYNLPVAAARAVQLVRDLGVVSVIDLATPAEVYAATDGYLLPPGERGRAAGHFYGRVLEGRIFAPAVAARQGVELLDFEIWTSAGKHATLNPMAYFLAKTDPETYSLDDLEREKKTIWDGVTNPQAVDGAGGGGVGSAAKDQARRVAGSAGSSSPTSGWIRTRKRIGRCGR